MNIKNDMQNKKEYRSRIMTVKTSLKDIARSGRVINIIKDKVIIMTKTVKHTYYLLKLYILYNFENNKKYVIDKDLVREIAKLLSSKYKPSKIYNKKINKLSNEEYDKLSNEDKKKYNKEISKKEKNDKKNEEMIKLRKDLGKLRNKYFKLIGKKISLDHEYLSTVIDEAVTQILTSYENHIKEHFGNIVNRYFNVFLPFNKYLKEMRKAGINVPNNKNGKEGYYKILKAIKNRFKDYRYITPVINPKQKKNKCIFDFSKFSKYVPNRNLIKYNMIYNMKIEPYKYLNLLITMTREIISKEEKCMSVFPLRKSNIPIYINIGTTSAAHLFIEPRKNFHGKQKGYLVKKILNYSDLIWSSFFKTNKKIFNNKNYFFGNSISTDGIACSVQMIRKGTDLTKTGKVHPKYGEPKNYKEFIYLRNENPSKLKELRKLKPIGIDPGKQDLIYCTDGEVSVKTNGALKPNIFRYSQDQRRYEIKTKRYRDILKFCKDEKTFNAEKKLSIISSKYCDSVNTMKYIKLREKYSDDLELTYHKEIYRKLKWYGFINKQRSESNMINRFREKFGNNKEVLVCIGDWSEKKPLPNNEPTKGKSIRKLFKRHGYKLYLINEYNTSKKSFINGLTNEKFMIRKNPRPYVKGNKECHGLLRCKNVSNKNSKSKGSHILVNRDLNGSMNILAKAKCILNNKKLPSYLQRKK